MPYKVFFEPEKKIIHIKVSGLAEKKDHFKAVEETLKIYNKINAKRLLVDLNELKIENYSTVGCFNFGKLIVKSFPNTYIAHVLPLDSNSRNDVQFISTVESNRGGFTAEFENIEDAREWLFQK